MMPPQAAPLMSFSVRPGVNVSPVAGCATRTRTVRMEVMKALSTAMIQTGIPVTDPKKSKPKWGSHSVVTKISINN